MTEPHENSITLDFSQGAYVDLEDLSIWIADLQDTTNPLYAHWVAERLLEAIKGGDIGTNGGHVKVDDRLKSFLSQRLKVQLPSGEVQVIARETPRKEFISEAVNAYQSEEGTLPGSLNVLLAFAVKNGVRGYTSVSVAGNTQKDKVISFTDTEKRTATFETMNDNLKAELSRIKQD